MLLAEKSRKEKLKKKLKLTFMLVLFNHRLIARPDKLGSVEKHQSMIIHSHDILNVLFINISNGNIRSPLYFFFEVIAIIQSINNVP